MHVLIVEDEPSIADTVQYALQTEHIDTTWVGTGQSPAPKNVIFSDCNAGQLIEG